MPPRKTASPKQKAARRKFQIYCRAVLNWRRRNMVNGKLPKFPKGKKLDSDALNEAERQLRAEGKLIQL